MQRLSLSLAAIAAISLVASAHADLAAPTPWSGSTASDVWQESTSSLTAFGNSGYGTFPGFAPWPGPIVSDDGDAGLSRPANGTGGGGAYPASGSLYFGNTGSGFGGSLAVTDATPLAGVANVVYQVELATGGAFGFYDDVLPTLSVNGGTPIAPTFSRVADGLQRGVDPVEGNPVFSDVYTLQWDVSGVVDPITSLRVAWSGYAHSSVYAMRLDQSDTFALVPEPTALAAIGLGAMPLVARRRRPASR